MIKTIKIHFTDEQLKRNSLSNPVKIKTLRAKLKTAKNNYINPDNLKHFLPILKFKTSYEGIHNFKDNNLFKCELSALQYGYFINDCPLINKKNFDSKTNWDKLSATCKYKNECRCSSPKSKSKLCSMFHRMKFRNYHNKLSREELFHILNVPLDRRIINDYFTDKLNSVPDNIIQKMNIHSPFLINGRKDTKEKNGLRHLFAKMDVLESPISIDIIKNNLLNAINFIKNEIIKSNDTETALNAIGLSEIDIKFITLILNGKENYCFKQAYENFMENFTITYFQWLNDKGIINI